MMDLLEVVSTRSSWKSGTEDYLGDFRMIQWVVLRKISLGQIPMDPTVNKRMPNHFFIQ
ncbi:hypothetical protein QJS10_CPA10g01469 [Acorus calamus]|uniref:Uncharacterized protein n=1 Tax=Acorus calamus TaxID=4465 RepID=A0AAV9E294_ACOCL|nr:hypothetical protein QJS10_CPA10g01469 [Acorus calamus]